MDSTGKSKKSTSKTWRSLPADLTDEEWELIADLVPTYSGGGRMGRPPKWSKRQVVDAILYVAATGCQWRALPPQYPHWNTVHRYHLTWSRDGTWERIVDRLRGLVRAAEGRERDPSGSIIDARSVRAGRHRGSAVSGRGRGRQPLGQRRWDSSRRPGRYQIPAPQEDMARQRIQEILRHPLLRVRYHLPSREQGLRSLL